MSVVSGGLGNGIKSKTLVRNSESYKEMATGAAKSEKSSPENQDHRMAILNFSKNDLLQLLGLLEAELEARELVITSLKTECAKNSQPSSNHYKQYTLHNPYAALSRDEEDRGGVQEDVRKGAESDPADILEKMVDRHRKAEEHMKQQLEDLSKSHNQVLKELALERQKHAQETAHGDDVTYFLEKDRERLSQQVDFEKAQQKKMERETKRAQSVLIDERKKHMSVVKALLDEHRFLQNELAEALQRLEHADCEAHACKVDATKALGLLSVERQKSEKREAEIERQISEFDIEREQLLGKLKREESRTKKLQETLDEANSRVNEVEHVLELSRELRQKDSLENVTRTKSTEPKAAEDSNSVAPVSYRPKSSTFPSSSSAGHLNLSRSSKLFAPRGFKSPLKPDKSESSSGSSEELSSPNTQKINVRIRNRSSGDFAAKRGSSDSLERSSGDETVIDVHTTSVTIKPKVASVTPSRRTIEAARKGLSPANSVDKLSTKERSSTPTDLTKISKIPAMTKKVVTVGVVSPQQTRKVNEVEIMTKAPESNQTKDCVDSTSSKLLSRPNNFSKPAINEEPSPDVTPPKQKDVLSPTSTPGRPILPYTTFSGVNVKAKAAQLISPGAKRNLGSPAAAGNSWIACPAPCLLNWTHPLHQAALRSDSAMICRLIEEKTDPNVCDDKDGSTPLFVSALVGSDECLELLLNLGGNCSVSEEHGFTPLHAAAYEGHVKCCKLLIDHGSKVNSPDDQDWLPIHWAVVKGHTDCVRILSNKGANLSSTTKTGWTVFHIAARFGQTECLKSLLDLLRSENHNSRDNNYNPLDNNKLESLVTAADQDSWTVAHLLASAGNLHGLKILHDAKLLCLTVKDQWNRTPMDIASDACKKYLNSLVGTNVQLILDVTSAPSKLDISPHGKRPNNKTHFTIGSVTVGPSMSWEEFHNSLTKVLSSHCQFLNSIVRENKSDNGDDSYDPPQGLGINSKSIKALRSGSMEWSIGHNPLCTPPDLFKTSSVVNIKLNGATSGSLDHLAYESMIPVDTLQNYLRLIEQYKRVIFYGPVGCGKTHLVFKMAEVVKARLEANGRHSDITLIPLNARVTHNEFIKLLHNKGFLVPTSHMTFHPKPSCPVLILDGLEKITMSEVFGDLLQSLEHPTSPTPIKVPNSGSSNSYILNRECVIIGAMDRARPSVDLSLQQHLRWIRLHWEQEPVISLLTRNLLRTLADRQKSSILEDGSLEPITWVCQVWHSFNESLVRLGLPDLVLGPKKFFACPFGTDMVEGIRRWMCLLWNHSLAPMVEEAVQRGGMRNTSDDVPAKEKDKVANTALYVLLQKAVFPGCPVPEHEREDYFSTFRGVNATLSQLNSLSTNNTRRPRRSKSMDRNRTSNKAAAIAKRQMLQEYAGTESNRNSRSFIPRRIGTAFARTSLSPPPVAEKPKISSSSGSKSIPTSPAEERDIMESLLQLNGSQSQSSIEELIQLQEKLFGQNNNRSSQFAPSRLSNQSGRENLKNGPVGTVEKEQTISRPMPHGTPTKGNRKMSADDTIWSVWEETV
ncbi:uncharacterized protein [Apostichopus japonicus]|uniref:uncharacterized protein isoform X3 n=1 Tax=Stichopus japonicus TaxID=307972 RepID=UPI003AB136B1